MNLNNLITDYFTLTGRPLATMTVEEYLSFLRACNGLPVKNEISVINTNEEPVVEPTNNPQNNHVSSNVVNKPNIPAKKKNDENQILEFMRSING